MAVIAVGYLRMSSKKQDKSIVAQRAEIEKYAKAHGYDILRWYTDEGISGSESVKRVQFQQLIKDAETRGDFSVILVWDQDRFSRFDPMEANHYWFLLRESGVRIVTVTAGPLELETLAGWLTSSINQHGKEKYLRDLAFNVLRGRRDKALRGKWQGNRAPYGYRIVNGGDLEPDDTAAVVRDIFRRYAETDCSLWDLAHHLNSSGVPSPRGGSWKSSTVQLILRRSIYHTGETRQLCNPKGKYHSVVNGEIVAMNGRRPDPGEGQVVLCKPIVTAATWRAANANLRRRQRGTSNVNKGQGGAVLVGLMHCANCGAVMYAGDRARSKGSTVKDRVFWCSTYHHQGKHACTRNMVHESALLDFLIPRLQEMLLSPATAAALEEHLRSEAEEAARPTVDLGALRKRLAGFESDIAAAARELKRTPDDLYDLAVGELRRLRRERDAAAAVLASQEALQISGGNVAELVRDALAEAQAFQEALSGADRQELRHALRSLIERIDLWFESVPSEKHTRTTLIRGNIQFREDSRLSGLANQSEQVGIVLSFVSADLSPVQFDYRRQPSVDRGAAFLSKYLAAGPKPFRECHAASGVSLSTLRRAAARLGVVFDGSGMWRLPKRRARA